MTTDIQTAYDFITERQPKSLAGEPFIDALAGKPTGYAIGMDRVILHVCNAGCKGAGVDLSEADKAELISQVTAFQKTLPPWESKTTDIF